MPRDNLLDFLKGTQHRQALADRAPVARLWVNKADDVVVEARHSPQRIKQEIAFVRAHHKQRTLPGLLPDHLHIKTPAAADRDDSAGAQQPPVCG